MMRGLAASLAAVIVAACGSSLERRSSEWNGTVDTLSSGQVVVRNTSEPVWRSGEEWRVVEDLRIGRLDGDGADVFGRVASLTVDGAGRIWVLESQAQEIRVFDRAGAFVRTVGQRGGGPGELSGALHLQLGADGHVYVMDPRNTRLSVFDTAGTYVGSQPALGSFVISPWPGRFDDEGRYYAPVPGQSGGEFRVDMVRYDAEFVAGDTLRMPRDPVQRERFEFSPGPSARLMAGVPFQGTLRWRISPAGTVWALLTDEYRLFELTPRGDTLRTITRAFEPLRVTAADRDRAREDLAWFTEQGGQIDLSRLPGTKAPVDTFFLDDEGHLWIERVTAPEEEARLWDIFDPDGRFLGTVTLPFALSESPIPWVRDGFLYGVTEDELEVPYVVRARVEGR